MYLILLWREVLMIVRLLVKKTFNDQELNTKYQFTAINSINWFRILPQSIYYAWAYLNHNIDSFVVPSGNFGNIYSAHLLKSMGFPETLL